MSDLLLNLSRWSTPVIAVLGGVHLLAFAWLYFWSRRDNRALAGALDEFTRPLKHRSLLGPQGHLSEQVSAFLSDVEEVLDSPERIHERRDLFSRINVLDERRQYLQSAAFDTAYSVVRTMVEAYPLLGILGTILAIGVALQEGSDPSVSNLVGRFGEAIWSTFAGLIAAILLMAINSLLEPAFARLQENRHQIRDTVLRVKRQLALAPGGGL